MITAKINDKLFKGRITRAIDIATKTGPIMRKVSGEMLDAVETNFAQEGRPKWKRLKDSTRERRELRGYWPGKILQVTGHLASSISKKHTRTDAIVGTNVRYARYLQYGTNNMPARPFLKLTQKDLAEIKKLIKYEFTHKWK